MTVQNAEGTQGTNTEQAAGAGAAAGAAGAAAGAAGGDAAGAQGAQGAGAPGSGDDPVKLKRDFAAMTGQVSKVSRENAALKAELERLKNAGAAGAAGAAGNAAPNQGNAQEQQRHEAAVERAVLLHVASTGTPLKPRVIELLVADAKRTLSPNADGKVEGVEALVEGFLGELKASLGGSSVAAGASGTTTPNSPDPARPGSQSTVNDGKFDAVKDYKAFTRLSTPEKIEFEKRFPGRQEQLFEAHSRKLAGR